MPAGRPPFFIRYPFALLAPAAALGAAKLLEGWSGAESFHLLSALLLAAVMASAWLGGLAPGLVSAILAALAWAYGTVSSSVPATLVKRDFFFRGAVLLALSLVATWLLHDAFRRGERAGRSE